MLGTINQTSRLTVGPPDNPGIQTVGQASKQAIKIMGLPISMFIFIFTGAILVKIIK
jgi:hypothetical protein